MHFFQLIICTWHSLARLRLWCGRHGSWRWRRHGWRLWRHGFCCHHWWSDEVLSWVVKMPSRRPRIRCNMLWTRLFAYLLVLHGSRARIVWCAGRNDPQLVKQWVSELFARRQKYRLYRYIDVKYTTQLALQPKIQVNIAFKWQPYIMYIMSKTKDW